jgi:hypothetical protein
LAQLTYGSMAPARLSGSGSGFSYSHRLPIRRAPASNCRAGLPDRVTPSLPSGGAGILTGCPSPTPLGLGLGPPNPTRIDLPSETLDLRRTRFSRVSRYSYRHSHFCALHRSFRYDFYARRTLPYQSDPKVTPRGFGAKLEPRYIFRARSLDQ